MALKKNEEGPNKGYWEFIERMAKEEREQRPHWAVGPSGRTASDESNNNRQTRDSSKAQNVFVMGPR